PGQVIVLVRSKAYGPLLTEEISKVAPVAPISDPYAAFGESDGRCVVLYLRLLRNENDNLAWRELLRIGGGFGDQPVLAMREDARLRGKRFVEVLNEVQRIGDNSGIPRASEVATYVSAILDQVTRLRERQVGDALKD